MTGELRQSPLQNNHVELGARMVPFAGWNMPVQYEGIIPEVNAVRNALGVFDISHMGQLRISGDSASAVVEWLDSQLTNNVASLSIGQGQYTFLLNEQGGVIDDLIIYRWSETSFFLVVNASKTSEDAQWLQQRLPEQLSMQNLSEQYAGLAVQGPRAAVAFEALCGDSAKLPERFCMAEIPTDEGTVIVCRTGYTGEDGFELFCPTEHAAVWWQRCLNAGASPCGLGARDLLRLEKCYPLNGSDLSAQRTPLEAGMAFAVDLKKASFTGRDAIVQQKAQGEWDRLVAIRQTEKSPPPRPGYSVIADGKTVGTLTSGGMSPTLQCGISLAYLQFGYHEPGTQLSLEIRGKQFPAEVVRKPFV